ncbi:MAG: hypothetical protein Q3972_04005 [Corynebacterium sp.]|nr:hypothetical protein [Corynebacterium sp.]
MNNTNPLDQNMVEQAIRGLLLVVAVFVALVGLFGPNEIKDAPTTTQSTTAPAYTPAQLGPNGDTELFNEQFKQELTTMLQNNAFTPGDDTVDDAAPMADAVAAGGDATPTREGIQWRVWIKGTDNEAQRTPRQVALDYFNAEKDYLPQHSSAWSVAVRLGQNGTDVIVVYAWMPADS